MLSIARNYEKTSAVWLQRLSVWVNVATFGMLAEYMLPGAGLCTGIIAGALIISVGMIGVYVGTYFKKGKRF